MMRNQRGDELEWMEGSTADKGGGEGQRGEVRIEQVARLRWKKAVRDGRSEDQAGWCLPGEGDGQLNVSPVNATAAETEIR